MCVLVRVCVCFEGGGGGFLLRQLFIYIYIKYEKEICTLYSDCFVFVPKTCNVNWQLASFSKVLHSYPDTVLNVGKEKKQQSCRVRDFQRTVKFAWVQLSTERSIHSHRPRALALFFSSQVEALLWKPLY